MGNLKITGLTTLILLISLMLIGVTVASIITDGTTGTTTEQDFDQMTNEIIDEISTYLQIKDQKGKYYTINSEKRIQKIAILISPMVSQNIDISQLTIQLNNGEEVRILTYINNSEFIESNSLFGHPIWNNITHNRFGFISIHDKDHSLVDYNLINENTDMAYVIIKLPDSMEMSKGEKIIVTLFPSTGITRTTILEAPLPMKSVITFE